MMAVERVYMSESLVDVIDDSFEEVANDTTPAHSLTLELSAGDFRKVFGVISYRENKPRCKCWATIKVMPEDFLAVSELTDVSGKLLVGEHVVRTMGTSTGELRVDGGNDEMLALTLAFRNS